MLRHTPLLRVFFFFHSLTSLTSAEEQLNSTEPPADSDSVVESLGDLVVIGTRTPEAWINSSGTTLRSNQEELLRLGSQDLSGFSRYDPTVSLPFDFASGDGAFAYGQSGYGSINIRGAEGNRVAIELDGIRQPPQYVSTSFDQGSGDGAGGVGRDYFDPALFDLVEVLKGGASALYGSDALGGVVSFTTPEPESLLKGRNTGGLLRTQYFSANQSLAGQAGGAVKQGNTAILLIYAGRIGQETANRGTLPPNPLEFRSYSFLLKANHSIGDHAFHFALESFDRETRSNVRSAVVSDFPVFTDRVWNQQLLERQRLGFRWIWSPQAQWLDELNTHAYWQYAGSTSGNLGKSKPLEIFGTPIPGTERTRRQRILFDTEIFGLTSVARKQFDAHSDLKHQLLAGIDASVESSENRFTRFERPALNPPDRTSFAPSETTRLGFFLQDEIQLQQAWFLTPGIRFDWQEIVPEPNQAYLDRLAALGRFAQLPPAQYENFSISPRLNLGWKPTTHTQWYATYAHGVRNPSAEELSMIFDHPASGGNPAGTLTVPNPSLQEETSDAFELGFKSDGDAGRFQASLYYTYYRNFIENGVSTGLTDDEGRDIVTTVNRGQAEIYGFELSGYLDLGHFHQPASGWQLGATTGKSIGNNLTNHQPLNSIEPWKTAAFISYENPSKNFGSRLTGTYTAEVEEVNDQTNQGRFFRPPAWFTLDLATWWQPTDSLTVHLGFNNLLDEKYWSWGSVRRGNGHLGGQAVSDRTTAPGRNFSISITKTF